MTPDRPNPIHLGIPLLLLLAFFGGAKVFLPSVSAQETPGSTPAVESSELQSSSPPAADTAESSHLYESAVLSFQGKFYGRAAGEFHEFTTQFPNSRRLPKAVLLHAQALYKLQQFEEALQLLNEYWEKAGDYADQYLYWLGQLHLERSQYANAVGNFSQLLKQFPDSSLRLDAAYGEALARFKLGEFNLSVELLTNPEGTFQKAVQTNEPNELVRRGQLLLVEAYLQQANLEIARQLLHRLSNLPLNPELQWHRHRLLIQLHVAENQPREALDLTGSLIQTAHSTGRAQLIAESINITGNLLIQSQQPEAAIQTFQQNQKPNVPDEKRREALLHSVQLLLQQRQLAKAVQLLQSFQQAYPADQISDLVGLTLGELQLRRFYSMREQVAADANHAPHVQPPPPQEFPAKALKEFDSVIQSFPESPLIPKAHYNRGWALWELGRYEDCIAAFQTAIQLLNPPEELAVARFKLADAQFQRKEFPAAIANYRAVINQYVNVPNLPARMVEQALYQIVRSSLNQGDAAEASKALQQILSQYPNSFFCDRSLLLVGQNLNQQSRPAEAREIYSDFLKRLPESPLRDEVQLAIARTYVKQGDWKKAIPYYQEWVDQHPDSPKRPQVQFDLAWLYDQAEEPEQALRWFDHFVAHFPHHKRAPLAQNWIADYHFRQGDPAHYVKAEINYKILFQNTNWPTSQLTYNAYLMAGRSALARRDFNTAQKDYLFPLITLLSNDPDLSPDLLPEALFVLGDSWIEKPTAPQNMDNFAEAIKVFSRITNSYPNHPFTPPAIGKIGNCHLQMAQQESTRLSMATNAYHQVLQMTNATAATRSLAEIGLGESLARLAADLPAQEQPPILERALNHFLNVVYWKNYEPAPRNPVATKEAGLAAGKLLESRGQYEQARELYRQLTEFLPSLQNSLEARIENLSRFIATSSPSPPS